MKIVEFEVKDLLAQAGLSVPAGRVVSSLAEVPSALADVPGPVVLKAQIPSGRRMKAGGVRFAQTPEAALAAAEALLAASFYNFTVERVLIEAKLEVTREIFIAVTYDAGARTALILASLTGGIEVESAENIVRRPFSLLWPIPEYLGREVAAKLGFGGSYLLGLGDLITQVTRCFVAWDALLLELNPVILDHAGRWWVADAHLELDEEAYYRQQALLARTPISAQLSQGHSSEFEQRAAQIDRADHRGVAGRLVSFDGDLGLLIGGGGASLTIMDALLEAGLQPANYCEIGGNPSVWKIKELTKLILQQPQVKRLAVIMNVVNNTRVDLVARGVIKGVLELGRDPAEVIVAFRIPGSWEEEGESLLRYYRVPFFGRQTSIDQVVEAIKWAS